jgi:antiviral helicase SKI2
MILNLLRVEALKIEEMIKRSFSENKTQTLLPEHQRQVQLSQEELEKLGCGDCDTCSRDLESCVLTCDEIRESSTFMLARATRWPGRIFTLGRLVVVQQEV